MYVPDTFLANLSANSPNEPRLELLREKHDTSADNCLDSNYINDKNPFLPNLSELCANLYVRYNFKTCFITRTSPSLSLSLLLITRLILKLRSRNIY